MSNSPDTNRIEENAKAIQKLIAEGKALRNQDDIPAAMSKFSEADDLLGVEPDLAPYGKVISWLLYEKAFALSVEGKDYAAAADMFKKSGEGGDKVQVLVADFRWALTRFLGGLDDARGVAAYFSELQDEVVRLRNDPDSDPAGLSNAAHNLLKRRCDLEFELRSPSFLSLSEAYLNQPDLVAVPPTLTPMHELERARMYARQLMFNGKNDTAAAIFAAIHNVSLSNSTLEYEFHDLSGVRTRISQATEEIAKDYRDLARALLSSTRPNKIKEALEVVDYALANIGPGRGNKVFLEQLITLRESLKT
nr:hypothetical protein [uncultured Hyphomonas sp.]